ncbi:nuclear factor 7, brain-like [Dendropsophus ebraccatus]|uniref:nuclear factor 7, brain-like n=1 Tax=Dendropsophus ebraccatus TaxID=150705 RepID=UPI003831286D
MALPNDELICSICLSTFKDPVMLNCGHNYCRGCINLALNNRSRPYSCPECRAQFLQRPVLLGNRKLSNIIQYLQKHSQEKLQNSLLDLTRKREATKKRVESLNKQRGKIQETSDILEKTMDMFFKMIIKDIKNFRKTALREISRKREHALMQVSRSIQDLEIRKNELSRKIQETQEMLNMADTTTFLQQEPDTEDGYLQSVSAEIHLDEKPINLIVKRCLSSVNATLSEVMTSNPGPKASDILLDVKTACNYIRVSPDCRSASYVSVDQGYQERSERFNVCQVLSTCSSSAQQYWEVDVSKAKEWIVGVAYHSIDRKTLDEDAYIGFNEKSWCLENRNGLSALHNKVRDNVTVKSPVELLGVYVDYDSGIISFYQLNDYIRHLYSFSATFTEGLHAAFYVFPDSCFTIQKREPRAKAGFPKRLSLVW